VKYRTGNWNDLDHEQRAMYGPRCTHGKQKFLSLEWRNDGVMNDKNDKNEYDE